jgi:hypothetical protein
LSRCNKANTILLLGEQAGTFLHLIAQLCALHMCLQAASCRKTDGISSSMASTAILGNFSLNSQVAMVHLFQFLFGIMLCHNQHYNNGQQPPPPYPTAVAHLLSSFSSMHQPLAVVE